MSILGIQRYIIYSGTKGYDKIYIKGKMKLITVVVVICMFY